MFKKIKQKLNNAWQWVKSKTKKILISLGIIGVVLAAGVALQLDKIPFVMVNGERIEFPYTDDNTGENLIIRTDKMTYGDWDEADVYVMVENKSGTGQIVNLQVFFSDESKSVAEISKLRQSIPYEVDVPDYKVVDYDCSIAGTSSTTQEIMPTKKTCQKEEQIGTHKETQYKDEWQSQILSDFSIHENNLLIAGKAIPEKDKKGFKTKKKIETPILKNAVTYYKIKIKFPHQTKDNFFIEAIGTEGGYGHLDPWYNASWLYRRAITIDETKVDDDLTNFPVMVGFASSTISFDKMREDGFDVRFTQSDGTTLLDYERALHSSSSAATLQGVYFVRFLNVASSTATTGYIYYGNSAASDAASSTAVWNTDYKSVYHLEQGNADALDSKEVNTLTKTGTLTQSVGQSGNAVSGFTDATNYLAKATGATLFTAGNADRTQFFSVYLTAVPSADNVEYYFVQTGTWATNNMFTNVLGQYAGVKQLNSALHGNDFKYTYTPATLAWLRMAWVYTAVDKSSHIYLNGALLAEGAHPSNSNWVASTIAIGSRETGGYVTDGRMDEVFLYNAASSAAWIKADYNSIANTLLTIGAEEATAVSRVIIIE